MLNNKSLQKDQAILLSFNCMMTISDIPQFIGATNQKIDIKKVEGKDGKEQMAIITIKKILQKGQVNELINRLEDGQSMLKEISTCAKIDGLIILPTNITVLKN